MSRVEDFCGWARRPRPDSVAALDGALAGVLRELKQSAPAFEAADDGPFLRHLAERLPATGDLTTLVAAVHAADLYLSFASGLGRKAALRALDQRLSSVCRGTAGPSVEPEELCQHLRERLLVSKAGGTPKIWEYTGRGPLNAWLKVTALRTRMNLMRAPREGPVEADELQALAGAGRDLELDYIQARHRERFRTALTAAFQALEKRERTLLRLQCLEGLTADQVGRIYHVSRPTAGRWLQEARTRLVAETRRRLAEDVASSEVEGLISLLGSHLDLTLSGLFRTR